MEDFFCKLKNHFKNDHLCDWFEYHQKSFKKDKTSLFLDNLIQEKKEYSQKILDIFLFKYPQYILQNQDTNQMKHHINYNNKYIFLNTTLYSEKYKIYLKPDIIIHKDIFKEIFNEIDTIDLPQYIIFDILYVILNFNSDKTDLLNNSNLYYYKCKISLAYKCLNLNSKYGYLLGKEYKYKDKILPKKKYIGKFPIYSEYFDDISDGINWLKKLKKNYMKWKIFPEPSEIELYPNMNCKDTQWNNEKNKLATKIKEITLLWNISYEKRCSLILNNNIKTWDDPYLLSHYELKNHLPSEIKHKMIHINNQNDINIIPRKIKNIDFLHILKTKNKIILDIESVNHLEENNSYFYNHSEDNKPKLCIIGTIYEKNKEIIYKDFTINYLTHKEEEKIISYFFNYLINIFKKEKIYIYHWGNAEKVYMKYMIDKYPDIKLPNYELIDLCYYFKKEPIIIKNCFNYGLKNISNTLYQLGYLKNVWEEDMNGLDAMYLLLEYSKKSEIKKIPLKRWTEIKKIVKYNYYDCYVLYDIINMLLHELM